jgi:hypothetical protein
VQKLGFSHNTRKGVKILEIISWKLIPTVFLRIMHASHASKTLTFFQGGARETVLSLGFHYICIVISPTLKALRENLGDHNPAWTKASMIEFQLMVNMPGSVL